MPPELPESSPAAAATRLSRALELVLRPMVRLMLSQGITYRPATDLLSRVYVEIATEELERAGKKATDSRLTVMTGIHRKALRQHRANPDGAARVPKSVALGAQLVTRWTSDPHYCDATGQPLPLPRRAEGDDDAPSFDGLVRSVSSDVHPRTVLDEWLRLGVVQIEDDQVVELVTAAFIPSQGFEEKLFYLGRNIHDHLDTTVHNLENTGPSRLERSVHYEGLSTEDVNRLSVFAEQEGMKLLEEINRRAREMRTEATEVGGAAASTGDGATRDDDPQSGLEEKAERMNFGLYFYRGPATSPEAIEEEDAANEGKVVGD